MSGLARHVAGLAAALDWLAGQEDRLDAWARRLADLTLSGGRLLVAGNGGSAAEAQHLTAELVGRFEGERVPLSAIALHAETSSLTAIVNDYGADEMFARQVAAHGRAGDVLLVLSTSGRSPNVLTAAGRARALGLTTWALTGAGPNPLTAVCDDALCVPARETSTVQEAHLVAVHGLCAAIDRHVRASSSAAARSAVEPPGAGSPEVVVLGDVVLDEDVDGQVTRFAPDGPVPVVDTLAVRRSPGGAGLAALLCARSAPTRLVAPLATDRDAGTLAADLAAAGVDVVPLAQDGSTRRKQRVRSAGRTIVRVDDGGPAAPVDVAPDALEAAVAPARAVLVSDYGGGTTHDPAVRAAVADAARTRPVVWDPHPRGGAPVPGVTVVTPNLDEARDAAADLGLPPDGDPATLARALREAWDVGAVCVTAAEQGAYLAADAHEPLYVPAHGVAGDPCGAGDRFAAALAVGLGHGVPLADAVRQAVGAATAWVGAGGAEGFRRGAGEAVGATAEDAPDDLAALRDRLHGEGRTVVATGGCFDVLHAGHVALLEAAARLGDTLVVLLNSDTSVRRLKGPRRPAVGERDRARVLRALAGVDHVVVFDDDDPRAALDALRPDVWAKGGDYAEGDLPEADVVRAHGGRVVLLPYVEGRSTSLILAGTAPGADPDQSPTEGAVP
ncbi:PfkB family carbohydrate kinase [Luteimicrobium sp. NPDC057192]|uniref:PfkB family carbohydrate kinase n=1 Tax=Luteimicrobium sp. NPDC057192 TaxID=3346042 RepID=UPI003635F055